MDTRSIEETHGLTGDALAHGVAIGRAPARVDARQCVTPFVGTVSQQSCYTLMQNDDCVPYNGTSAEGCMLGCVRTTGGLR
jgi:hypothetical protein